MRPDNPSLLYLSIILLSLVSVSGVVASPPLGPESWDTVYHAVPDPIQPGSFWWYDEFPKTFICEQFSIPYASVSAYFATWHITVSDGADSDLITVYHTLPNYTVETIEWNDGDTTLRRTLDNFSMNTPGFYIVQAMWDDYPVISARNDDPVYAYFTIRLWVPETTYFRQPSFTDCDIRRNGQSIVDQHLWCQFTTTQLISKYLDGMGIDYTNGYDGDERQIKTYNYYGNETISIDTVVDNIGGYWQDTMVTTAGVYPAVAQWYDGGEPNYFDDGTSTQWFTLHLWIPETTYLVEPLLQPGHIYCGYPNQIICDNTTFYQPVTKNYSLEKWFTANQISAGGGSDYDTRLITSYQINGQVTVSTSSCANTVYYTEPEEEAIDFMQPGVYTLTWTFKDVPGMADDPDTTRSITLVVFKVEISQPTSWPNPVLVGNSTPLTATITPAQALGGTYSWAKDSGDGEGCFTVNTSSVNTTLFQGIQIGDYYFHVNYTKSGATAHSDTKRNIIFWMDILGLGFDGNHTIQCNTTDIVNPVWSKETTPTKNEPVAYTKQSNLTMTAKFSITPTLPVSATIYLFAENSASDNLDALKTATVSGATADISGITSMGTLPNYVCITSALYQWKLSTDNNYFVNVGNSGPHTIYVTLSTPQAPMAKPWTAVLNKSCVWANGANTESYAASSITYSIYSSGAKYDGNTWHYTHPESSQFYLQSLLNGFPDVEMDCRDFANLTHVMTNSLGLNAQYNLIGSGTGEWLDWPFDTKYIWPAKGNWLITGWYFHQIGWWNSKVCDASLQLDVSTTTTHVAKLSQGDMSFNEYREKLTADTTLQSYDQYIADDFYFSLP